MFSSQVLEVVAAFGLIVAVWFALVGWKLLPLVWADRPGSTGASRTEK